MKRFRLAILTSHPIQYQAPLFRKIAQESSIDLMVYFCWDFGVEEKTFDREFGQKIQWDTPLLEGYQYKFLKNYSRRPGTDHFFGLINPGIVKELSRNKYDAIIIHGYNLASYLIGYYGAWVSRTPVIFRGETVLRPNRPLWLRIIKYIFLKIIFSGTAAFLTIGNRSREFYLYYEIDSKKLFFTPYAVDNDFFISKSDKYRRKNKLPVILFVGKLVPRKRPMDLLLAFEKIEANRANLIFVGDGALRGELENYVKNRNLKNIFFTGFKNQTELSKYYGAADIFVLPSEHEVSPLVINEAMAGRLPVIVADAVPSAEEFVKNGENGYIYAVGDVEELGEKLKKLIGNSADRERMAQKSRQLIRNWNYEICVKNIIEAIKFVAR